jgi:DNA repair protein RadC
VTEHTKYIADIFPPAQQKTILQAFKDVQLGRLARLNARQISEKYGIKFDDAKRITASLELGRQMLIETTDLPAMKSASSVWLYVAPRIGFPQEEHIWVLGFTTSQKPIELCMISKGNFDEAPCPTGVIFKELFRMGATRFILIHNHPAGSAMPSQLDLDLTEDLYQIGTVMSIFLVDHIIMGQGEYYSFTDHDLIDPSVANMMGS